MQSVSRSASILRALASSPAQGARLSEIAQRCQLDKSTALRILEALSDQGLVSRDEDNKRFRLGIDLVFLGWSAARNFAIQEMARPVLDDLANITGDTAYLTLRSGNESVCADRVLGSYPIKTTTIDVGNRRPLGVGAGSVALLAGLPEEQSEESIVAQDAAALAAFSGFTADDLRREVAASRQQGHSFTRSHVVPDVWGVGRWIRDPHGNTVGAVSMAAVSGRFANQRRDYLVSAVEMAAGQIEAALSAAA